MNQIDTASALAKMNDTWDHDTDQVKTFGLRFFKEGGVFREIFNARKGVKHPQQKASSPSSGNRGRSHKKLNGLVQVFDDDKREFRDIPYDCIVAFRDYNSDQWIPTRLT